MSKPVFASVIEADPTINGPVMTSYIKVEQAIRKCREANLPNQDYENWAKVQLAIYSTMAKKEESKQ